MLENTLELVSYFFILFMYGNFNAQEEHKGWTVAQLANSGVLPTKEKKYTTKQNHTTKQELA